MKGFGTNWNLSQLKFKLAEKKKKGEDENARAVGGQVRNEADEVVEGAVVQLKDAKSLKVKSYITKADGMYRFFGLSGNVDYELKASFAGCSLLH